MWMLEVVTLYSRSRHNERQVLTELNTEGNILELHRFHARRLSSFA